MNRQVFAIAGRLSLRPSQRRSLEILGRISGIVPPRKRNDLGEALAAIRQFMAAPEKQPKKIGFQLRDKPAP